MKKHLESILKNTPKRTYINEYGVKMIEMNYATWKDLVAKLRKLIMKNKSKSNNKLRAFFGLYYGFCGGLLATLIMLSERNVIPLWAFFIPIPLGLWLGWCTK